MISIPLLAAFAAFLLVLGCFILVGRRSRGTKRRHRRKMTRAERIYEKLNSDPDSSPGRLLSYLRMVDPYVFEELVLLAFEKQGFHVYRNKRYSGDGGIDGRIERNGVLYLLQMKRYRGHVNSRHVAEFCDLCRSRHCPGYFVHTGRTGKKSRSIVRSSDGVTVVSGQALYLLIVNKNKDSHVD